MHKEWQTKPAYQIGHRLGMMSHEELLQLFIEKVPTEYPQHMFCYFSNNANNKVILPFTRSLISTLHTIESLYSGYSEHMLDKIGSIRECGEEQYDSLLSILSEMYVTSGHISVADRDGDVTYFTYEPANGSNKNPEFEVRIDGQWCAVEVKNPRLISFSRTRYRNPIQLAVRLPDDFMPEGPVTLPRDNPVKDFLISADGKFEEYEKYRPGAFRVLVIVWDDFCHEPIAALISPLSGLLTDASFHRNVDGQAIKYPNVDGIVIIRHQHQFLRSTRCEPLIDGLKHPFQYHHDGFPPKAYIRCHGGRELSQDTMNKLNYTPLEVCLGAEYGPMELITWMI